MSTASPSAPSTSARRKKVPVSTNPDETITHAYKTRRSLRDRFSNEVVVRPGETVHVRRKLDSLSYYVENADGQILTIIDQATLDAYLTLPEVQNG